MTSIIVLILLGTGLGVVIGIVVKLFAVEADPRQERLEVLLPGANCGACGFAGCADFARALLAGKGEPHQCPSTPSDRVSQIASLLGIAVGARVPLVAVVRCGGGRDKSREREYNGVLDCRSAALVAGGSKACAAGCLGYGSCARICPFGAIEMTADWLAYIHPELCTGCRKCVAVCPRNLIVMVPQNAPLHVFCNSPAKGAEKTKFCQVSCIGCRKCIKAAPEGRMKIEGFLAAVNYSDPPDPAICTVCPTGCLRPAMPAANTGTVAPAMPQEASHV